MAEGSPVLGLDYARHRELKRSLRYRLHRRAQVVIEALTAFAHQPIRDILDLGTADGRVLDIVCRNYPEARGLGIEYNQELVEFAAQLFPHLTILQGDVQALKLPDQSFDVAIATAIIEHLAAPEKGLLEAWRVLRPDGLLVITAPDPFWEHVAVKVGLLKDDMHEHVLNLKQLQALARQCGFTILLAKKFMLSPVGLPMETFFEKLLSRISFDFLMANQLVVARKSMPC